MNKINVSISDGIFVIELNDPPANTYSYDMMREIDAAILGARMDDSVHVIVIRGAGEKFFCAGANISMLKEAAPEFKYYFCLHANETLTRLEQTPKLVIAALNGHTVGGGLEVALAADIRIARKDAGKIGLPEVMLGVLPGTGGTQRLARLVGKARAIELMATGRLMSFDEARDARDRPRSVGRSGVEGEELRGRRPRLRATVHAAAQGQRRRGTDEACGPVGIRGRFSRGVVARARTAAAAVPERRCARRHRGESREAKAGIQGTLAPRTDGDGANAGRSSWFVARSS